MSTSLVIQTFVLSGALGFLSLEYLQNHDAVTKTLSGADKNVYRVALGVIDYLIYLVIYMLLSQISMPEMIRMITAIFITALLVAGYTWLYGKWAQHNMILSNGATRLDAREMALSNPYGKGDIQADLFDLSDRYIVSGLLRTVNLESASSKDITLMKLPDGFTANKDLNAAIKVSHLMYLDTSSGIQYYLTYFSEPEQVAAKDAK
ncbi:hypothetical protein SH597_04555 [Lacticaseibacillus paracasei]|uniref:Uncharacterized protein n=1 Tax=Lacticaseibacillus paracasei TaxID=1597 RepID=A0ABD7BR70_LACPA|nr:hypothetical protein [Lacticaseibacillus paracasei]QOP54906.1 hypothetical protein HCJ88_03565 [Lacticaseibacillus paracasei]QPB56471.1 hypothetical protein GFB64_04880 [Lacticaseibacillus paracasei]WPQ31529.1 hypothetical protein SH597_04555 [Lacticaseibacillus paracasei]